MIKALIIDDEADICLLLSNILKNKNVEAAYVNTLSEAPHALMVIKPDIVFLDNHLPDGMGIDFIAYIKKNFSFSRVVMITAYDNSSDRDKAIQSGADIFIPKPFTRDIIYNTLEMLTAL